MLSVCLGKMGWSGPLACKQLHPPSTEVINRGESPELVKGKKIKAVSPMGILPRSLLMLFQVIWAGFWVGAISAGCLGELHPIKP